MGTSGRRARERRCAADGRLKHKCDIATHGASRAARCGARSADAFRFEGPGRATGRVARRSSVDTPPFPGTSSGAPRRTAGKQLDGPPMPAAPTDASSPVHRTTSRRDPSGHHRLTHRDDFRIVTVTDASALRTLRARRDTSACIASARHAARRGPSPGPDRVVIAFRKALQTRSRIGSAMKRAPRVPVHRHRREAARATDETRPVEHFDAPPAADRIEAFFLHALGALDPEELEDLLHGD